MYMDPSHFLVTEEVDTGGGGGGGGSSSGVDRFPQWNVQETRELLMIRAELDSTFMETKRNKLLWEVISTKMKEKGYNRNADQCKSKWKNLVTRYKGCETMEQDGTRQQFPFYDELQMIFANRMQRLLWMEVEGGSSGSRKREMKFASDNDESDVEKASGSSKRNKKKKGIESSSQCNPEDTNNGVISKLKDILEEYMKQEMQWMEWYKAREEDRRMKEMEWRQTMEALEKERTMLYERWIEREEKRNMREEDRAQKRDALVTALLNKLRSQDL